MLESYLDGLSTVENIDFDHLECDFGFRCLSLASLFGKNGYRCLNSAKRQPKRHSKQEEERKSSLTNISHRRTASWNPVQLHWKLTPCDIAPGSSKSRCWCSRDSAFTSDSEVFVEDGRGESLVKVIVNGPFGWTIGESEDVTASAVTAEMEVLVVSLLILVDRVGLIVSHDLCSSLWA